MLPAQRLSGVLLLLTCPIVSNPNPVLFALERRYDIRVRQGDVPTSSFGSVKFENLTAADAQDAKAYSFLTTKEFSKYPISLVRATGLKQIGMVKGLNLDNVAVGAVGDYKQEILYLDVLANRTAQTASAHVLHHDFFHLLEEQRNGSAYFKDPEWQALNPSGFTYGRGGIYARDFADSVLSNPSPGFINRYAMSGIEEDRAEVFACLFTKAKRQRVAEISTADGIVAEKVRLMKKQIAQVCPEANDEYFAKVAK